MANISSFPVATPTANDTLIGTKFIENKEATTNSFNLGEVAEFVAGYISVSPIFIGTANGLSLNGATLSLALASGSTNGALSSAGFGNLNSAYNEKINSISVTGTTTKLLTLNRQNASPLTASWVDGGGGAIAIGSPANGLSIVDDFLYIALANGTTTGALSSTNWNTFNNKQDALTFSSPLIKTGNAISIQPATSTQNGYLLANNWNAFNEKQSALDGSGIVKSTAGTISYLTDNTTNWNTAYNNSITTATVTGTTTKTLTLNQQDGGTVTASWTDEGGGVSSFNTRTGAVTLSSSDVTTALGYTPVTDARTITINGTTQSLAANQTWVVTAVETDTLASVTGRGASTSTLSTFNFGVNTVSQTNSQPGITNTMTSGSNGGRGAAFYGSSGLAYGSRSMDVYSSNYGAGIKFIIASTGYEQSNNAMWFFYQNTQVGSVSCTDTATTYATSSDYRLKENIQPVVNSLERVDSLNPCRFNFIVNPNKVVDGFIAHEVQAIVPEAVTGVKDEVDPEGTPMYQGIDQAKLVPLLTAAIQELHAKVKALELLVNPQ